MARNRSLKIDGVTFEIIETSIGRGGQGTVHKARRKDDPGQLAIIKELPNDPIIKERLARLIDLGIGYAIPNLSAPLGAEAKRGRLRYVAPFADGVAVDAGKPRTFPELLEIAAHFIAIWCRLEAAGIAHGDYSANNVLIADDGTVWLIDIDNFDLADGSAPKPQMIGQFPMTAPELRGSNPAVMPSILSDRFAAGGLINMITLSRHAADGLANTPAEFEKVMTKGLWPEELRNPDPGETPIDALGEDLKNLFRRAFSLSPLDRPSAEEWRQAILAALGKLHIHYCGGAFVLDHRKGICPWCGQAYERGDGSLILVIRNLQSGETSRLALADGAYTFVGRETIPNLSGFVSNRHVRFYTQGTKVYVDHVGRNKTAITFAGGPTYRLQSHKEDIGSGRLDGAVLQLADTPVEIRIEAS